MATNDRLVHNTKATLDDIYLSNKVSNLNKKARRIENTLRYGGLQWIEMQFFHSPATFSIAASIAKELNCTVVSQGEFKSDSEDDSRERYSDDSEEDSDDEEYGRFGYSYLDSKPRRSMYSSLMGFGSRLVSSGSLKSKPVYAAPFIVPLHVILHL
jgi:hypothetical protein